MLYLYELSYTVHHGSIDKDRLIEELKDRGLINSVLVEDQQTFVQIISKNSDTLVSKIIKQVFEYLIPSSSTVTFHLSKFEKGSTQDYEFLDGWWRRIK